MAYDVNKKVTAEDLETALDRTREYVDGSIPETLPADGGNAETANKLTTPRTINGVAFDGSEDIEIDAVTANEIADLKAYIGYTDSDIYGLEADFENNKFTRLAGAVGKTPGADFDSVNAFGGRRRCAISDEGAVIAYYGDSNYEEDGGYTDNEGNVIYIQTMVEQPKFYYKVVPFKTEKIDGANGYHLRKARYYISDTPKPGFKVHPAFVQNGIEVDRIYLSAYEGSIRDGQNHVYLKNDEQTADLNNKYTKLSSIINAKPASGTTQVLTRDNARKIAQNRGDGWGITTIQTLSATQLLFAVEYATFNSQTAIGNGIVNATESIKTGSTSSLGNASGSVALGGVSYRGEENLWGNMCMWCDGVNNLNDTPINDYGKLYVADHDFADNTAEAPYEDTEIRSNTKGGYISAFGYSEKYDWLFIASECSGNSTLPIGDRLFNSNAGWGTVLASGLYNSDKQAGAFYFTLNTPSSHRSAAINARLIYIPQNTETSQEVTAND